MPSLEHGRKAFSVAYSFLMFSRQRNDPTRANGRRLRAWKLRSWNVWIRLRQFEWRWQILCHASVRTFYKFTFKSCVLQPALSAAVPCTQYRLCNVVYLRGSIYQCFSTAGPRPGTGSWHQLYRAARGSLGICHFSFLSIFSWINIL